MNDTELIDVVRRRYPDDMDVAALCARLLHLQFRATPNDGLTEKQRLKARGLGDPDPMAHSMGRK